MTRSDVNPWLNRFAVLTALATLALIAIGGLVTSHEAGMAVPDWPTTYGYNMFVFPVSQWMGGIFYEHTHRLWVSVVGLLTSVLAAWIWMRESRGSKLEGAKNSRNHQQLVFDFHKWNVVRGQRISTNINIGVRGCK